MLVRYAANRELTLRGFIFLTFSAVAFYPPHGAELANEATNYTASDDVVALGEQTPANQRSDTAASDHDGRNRRVFGVQVFQFRESRLDGNSLKVKGTLREFP